MMASAQASKPDVPDSSSGDKKVPCCVVSRPTLSPHALALWYGATARGDEPGRALLPHSLAARVRLRVCGDTMRRQHEAITD